MFNIFDPNIIQITKGNTATIDITPINTATGDPYILDEGDKVLFTVKNRLGETVIQKVLTKDDYEDEEDTSINCDLDADDTKDLLTGEYKYDVLLVVADNAQAITFISSTFIITEAIGMYTDLGVNQNG